MKFGILVSTMNQLDFSLINKMNIRDGAVVVNQISNSKTDLNNEVIFLDKGIYWVNSSEKGLSRSRNLAMRTSRHKVALLSDDDIQYVDNVGELIENAFINNPNFDIITFQVYGKNSVFKKYSKRKRKVGYIASFRKASVEIAVNLDKIESKNIKFNELFGSGSTYQMGEDNIFLFDCLKKGLRIGYVPIKIGDLEVGKSTWFKGYTRKYFNDLGAVYTEMSRTFSLLFIVQFAMRKYKLYKNETKFTDALKEMLHGRKAYIKRKRSECI